MNNIDMNAECLICKKPLVYTETDEFMECALCHKREPSKTKCADGHYICNDCHTQGMDDLIGLCLQTPSKNPITIIRQIMHRPFCHMHGPEHHVMVGAALLTAFKNAGGNIELHDALIEMMNRGKNVPGGACGFWGACGAGISTGMFMSILAKSTPLANEPFSLAHRMTSKALDRIGKIGGPRCCQREAFLSILAAIDFVAKHFDVKMETENIVCEFYPQNNQCIGNRCPFFKTKINPL